MNTSQSSRKIAITLGPFAVFLMAANFVMGQEVFQPGELRQNIKALNFVIRTTTDSEGIGGGVAFDDENSTTQNMKLFARGSAQVSNSFYAYAEAMMYLDFCVPRTGLTTCDAVSDPNAPDITANITFNWGVIGVVRALGVGAKAAFHSYAEVFELESKRKINYQLLQDMSASLGTVKVVAKIPIPRPDVVGAEVTQPVAWTTVLKRGRRYRFRLYGLSSATTGFNVLEGNIAVSNFSGPDIKSSNPGKVQLQNLTISVSPDGTSNLQETLTSLQQQIGSLVDSIESLSARIDEDLAAIRQEHTELIQQVTTLEASLNDLRQRFDNHTHDCVVQQAIPRKGDDRYIVVCGPPVKRP